MTLSEKLRDIYAIMKWNITVAHRNKNGLYHPQKFHLELEFIIYRNLHEINIWFNVIWNYSSCPSSYRKEINITKKQK